MDVNIIFTILQIVNKNKYTISQSWKNRLTIRNDMSKKEKKM